MRKMKLMLISLIIVISCLYFYPTVAKAKGPSFIEINDFYFTKANCKIYAEPTYTTKVLGVLPANLPVQVIGYYTNGWYRIRIGAICYCKMDFLTPSGEFGSVAPNDKMGQDVMNVAKELGYKFHYITMNREKIIEKSFFNQYVGEKCILYTKINDDLGVYFKMIYDDPITGNIDLNYQTTFTEYSDGSRMVYFTNPEDLVLKGTICNFIYKMGYDKVVDIYIKSTNTDEYNLMNTFYTEFSEFAYAPITAVTDMYLYECETTRSLSDARRAKMYDLRKGIKYMEYDKEDYVKALSSKLRKDTEYIDYILTE